MTTESIALVALYISLLVHFTSTVWWAASLTKRVEHIERWVTQHEHTAERLASLELQLQHLSVSISRIEKHIIQK